MGLDRSRTKPTWSLLPVLWTCRISYLRPRGCQHLVLLARLSMSMIPVSPLFVISPVKPSSPIRLKRDGGSAACSSERCCSVVELGAYRPACHDFRPPVYWPTGEHIPNSLSTGHGRTIGASNTTTALDLAIVLAYQGVARTNTCALETVVQDLDCESTAQHRATWSPSLNTILSPPGRFGRRHLRQRHSFSTPIHRNTP